LNAFVPRTASDGREISSDPLDIIYDQLEEMLTGDRIRECDDFIRAVADEPSRSSLPAMIGILTVTRGMDARLPSRPTLRTVVENRLTGTGKNALAILKGL
jgi:hypothetical protein